MMRCFACTLLIALCATAGVVGCSKTDSATDRDRAALSRVKVQAVNLNDPVTPTAHDQPIVLGAAKNEWASFALQLTDLPPASAKSRLTLRINSPELPTSSFEVSQILSMPVDVNRAGYVRHTGLSVSARPLPRALLPVTITDGAIDLSTLRDASPLMLWVD